ncbi:MAG TPA: hypothetical protein VGN48_05915 [Pedococcus sp.]|jgi:hypothetical protein|nr:hypothetical protein [Pedococcus sp.]
MIAKIVLDPRVRLGAPFSGIVAWSPGRRQAQRAIGDVELTLVIGGQPVAIDVEKSKAVELE